MIRPEMVLSTIQTAALRVLTSLELGFGAKKTSLQYHVSEHVSRPSI
jgi:hypothetical protein